MINWIKRLFNKKENKSVKESINVVESIGKAKSLYKDLIIKAHPDKHPNHSELATTLTELINKNRYNYSELLKIKKRIETELQ